MAKHPTPLKVEKGTPLKGGKAFKSNSDVIIEARRRLVAERYLQGKSQNEIAEECGVTQPVISNDLKVIREHWRTQCAEKFDDAKSKELARLDLIECQLWDAWFQSKAPAETRIVKLRKAPDVPQKFKGSKDASPAAAAAEKLRVIEKNIEVTRRGQVGNPTFLIQIKEICELRLKVMGAFKEEKGGVNIFNINWDMLVGKPQDEDDPVEARIASVKQLPPHEDDPL